VPICLCLKNAVWASAPAVMPNGITQLL